MQKVSQIIANRVWIKLAETDDGFDDEEDEVPGYKALKSRPGEGIGSAALLGGLMGGGYGVMGASFNPELARRIPSDKLRMLAGFGRGAALGAGAAGGITAILNNLMNRRSEALKKLHLRTGDITPESEAKAEETWQRLYGKK